MANGAKRMKWRVIFSSALLVLMAGCSSQTKHPTGIQVVASIDENACALVGSITGGGLASLGRRTALNAAVSEAIYQAEALMATHVVLNQRNYDRTTGASVAGQAYLC